MGHGTAGKVANTSKFSDHVRARNETDPYTPTDHRLVKGKKIEIVIKSDLESAFILFSASE